MIKRNYIFGNKDVLEQNLWKKQCFYYKENLWHYLEVTNFNWHLPNLQYDRLNPGVPRTHLQTNSILTNKTSLVWRISLKETLKIRIFAGTTKRVTLKSECALWRKRKSATGGRNSSRTGHSGRLSQSTLQKGWTFFFRNDHIPWLPYFHILRSLGLFMTTAMRCDGLFLQCSAVAKFLSTKSPKSILCE